MELMLFLSFQQKILGSNMIKGCKLSGFLGLICVACCFAFSVEVIASPAMQGLDPSTLPQKVFLPWTSWNLWYTPTTESGTEDVQPEKVWTGIHLGNTLPEGLVGTAPWTETMFDLIDPNDGDGIWPAVIVVQSSNLYRIDRQSNAGCYVESATRNTDYPEHVFEYVKAAALRGIPIIVRITPSPGNFPDWNMPVGQQLDRNMIFDRPAGGSSENGDYCNYVGRSYAVEYREPEDIALEIIAIQSYNLSQGFEVFGFIPANEPNAEWYANPPGSDVSLPQPQPNAGMESVWEDMGVYFRNVHTLAHFFNVDKNLGLDIRVMTPPMAQGWYAEGISFFGDCGESKLLFRNADGDIVRTETGYNLMEGYYKWYNDGVTWHNYWLAGVGEDHSDYVRCEDGGNHVSYYFPEWLRATIDPVDKPPFILEADIASPEQAILGSINPRFEDKDSHIVPVSESIRRFFHNEYCYGGSDLRQGYSANVHIASWLLSDNSDKPEHHWHMAYTSSAGEVRPWFDEWWQADESIINCPHSVPSITLRSRQDIPLSTQVSSQNANSENVHSMVVFVCIFAVFTGLVSYNNLIERKLLRTSYSEREREDE